MEKRKINKPLEIIETYTPKPAEYYFYIGDKYYRRMQPTPYISSKLNLESLKKLFVNT